MTDEETNKKIQEAVMKERRACAWIAAEMAAWYKKKGEMVIHGLEGNEDWVAKEVAELIAHKILARNKETP